MNALSARRHTKSVISGISEDVLVGALANKLDQRRRAVSRERILDKPSGSANLSEPGVHRLVFPRGNIF